MLAIGSRLPLRCWLRSRNGLLPAGTTSVSTKCTCSVDVAVMSKCWPETPNRDSHRHSREGLICHIPAAFLFEVCMRKSPGPRTILAQKTQTYFSHVFNSSSPRSLFFHSEGCSSTKTRLWWTIASECLHNPHPQYQVPSGPGIWPRACSAERAPSGHRTKGSQGLAVRAADKSSPQHSPSANTACLVPT